MKCAASYQAVEERGDDGCPLCGRGKESHRMERPLHMKVSHHWNYEDYKSTKPPTQGKNEN